MRFSFPLISAVAAALLGVTSAVVHDETFIPDAVLRVTEQDAQQPCVPYKAVPLVNGTTPGPVLRFTEGETVWIRVYNDIETQNLTMVGLGAAIFCSSHLPTTALSRQRITRCLPVGFSSLGRGESR